MPARTFSPDALRQIRRERGVTQRKLAAEIGRDFTTVSQYETGRCAPSLEALTTIADVLGAPVTAFIKAGAA
ncbi:helix-turn-helix domain-containing protein [Streptomyces collinus]|uniref:helix-turn-helix domain-containing protein n=1 Tax=Streptomyces collinus TaxID=42684 RepID=UPI003793D471